jgi:hypothetical protein
MRRECERCNQRYDDENRSTICPHVGIGYCEICDCVLCVCDPVERARIRNKRAGIGYDPLSKHDPRE